MPEREIQDKPGLILALLIMLCMSAVIWVKDPVAMIADNYGICLVSPDKWQLSTGLSAFINCMAVLATALLMILLDKRYALVSGSSLLYASVYLVMTGADPWTTQWFGSSSLIALACILCLWLLFGCYGRRNATHTVFLIFSLLSFGSMVQYGFLMLALAFLVGLSYMRILRLKEILAMICGLAAPYWICIGMGLVRPQDIVWPQLSSLFAQGLPTHELTGLVLFACVGALIMLVMGYLNYRTVFASNGQIRACNSFMGALGFFCIWFIVFDFNNIVSWLGLLNVLAAIQVAHFFKHSHMPRKWLVPLSITVIYFGIFIFSINDWN